MTELLSGEVDVVERVPSIELLKTAGDARFARYDEFSAFGLWGIVWNLRHPILSDPRIRRALTLAMDRSEVNSALNLPLNTPIFDAPGSDDQQRRGEIPPPMTHDTAAAARLLFPSSSPWWPGKRAQRS